MNQWWGSGGLEMDRLLSSGNFTDEGSATVLWIIYNNNNTLFLQSQGHVNTYMKIKV